MSGSKFAENEAGYRYQKKPIPVSRISDDPNEARYQYQEIAIPVCRLSDPLDTSIKKKPYRYPEYFFFFF
jgi:hypothetical protein